MSTNSDSDPDPEDDVSIEPAFDIRDHDFGEEAARVAKWATSETKAHDHKTVRPHPDHEVTHPSFQVVLAVEDEHIEATTEALFEQFTVASFTTERVSHPALANMTELRAEVLWKAGERPTTEART